MKINAKTRYPWLFFDINRQWLNATLTVLLIVVLGGIVFFVYSAMSNDLAPDSIAGYTFAITGTFFMLLAAVSYSVSRRSRKRKVGQLGISLHWHVCFGVISLVLLCLHSFGHLNPRSGTYALYGMIALVFSGIIGRLLDRFVPRMIAMEASKTLTEGGEDRIEAISHNVQAILTHNTQQLGSLAKKSDPRSQAPAGVPGRRNATLPGSWDLAYLSLDDTPQELDRDEPRYRFVPDRKSDLAQPGALMPGLQQQMNELQSMQQVLQREQFLRALIRYWRVFHVCLALLTVGLLLWHLEFASELLITAASHH